MDEGGVEEQRKDEASLLLLQESMTMLESPGIVRVFKPITLSLEVHWEDVSELSVTVNNNRYINTLILDQTTQNINHQFPTEARGLDVLSLLYSYSSYYETLATPTGRSKKTQSQTFNLQPTTVKMLDIEILKLHEFDLSED